MNLSTSLDILIDPLTYYITGMYVILILWEAFFPARKLVDIKYRKIKGVAILILYFFLSVYLPLFIHPFFEQYVLIDLSAFGVVESALIGVLLYEFGVFLWHRQLHRSDFLWKTFHQMHHNTEQLDIYGALFFSPLDMIGWTVLSSVCFSLIGLSPEAITAALLIINFLSTFQHANIRTPRWIGYVIQRPEGRAVHHAGNIRKSNYSALPLFDMLFGTFKNPKNYLETGYKGASEKMKDMLSFKDISRREKVKKRTFTIDVLDLT